MVPLRRNIALMLVLLMFAGSPAQAAFHQNDAGTGGDAGDAPSEATALPGFGSYSAGLSTMDDADWYSIDNGDDTVVCLTLDATSDRLFSGSLDAGDGFSLTAYNDGGPISAALAVPAPSHQLYGFHPTGQNLLGTDYTFTADAVYLKDATAKDGGVLDEGCTFGFLKSGDRVDAYTFDVQEPLNTVFSLATAGTGTAQLDLVDPSGDVTTLVTDAGAQGVSLDEFGTYTLQVKLSSSGIIGYGIGDCHPYCIDILP